MAARKKTTTTPAKKRAPRKKVAPVSAAEAPMTDFDIPLELRDEVKPRRTIWDWLLGPFGRT